MSLGQYTRHFTLQRPVTTADTAGGQATTYATVMTLWGRLQALGSREQAQAGALQVLATHRVTTHARSRIVSTQRLVPKGWTGPTLDILSVVPDERGDEMVLDCAEVI